MSYSKIIFLDFDGVMTSMGDGTSHICRTPSAYGISASCKKWLAKVWKEVSDVKVVLSTSWLKFPDLEEAVWKTSNGEEYRCQIPELISWLQREKVFLSYVDYYSDTSKFGRIMTWITRNSGLVDQDTKFLILDDDASRYNLLQMFNVVDELDYGKYKFIQTDPTIGFNKECYEKSIAFFRS